MADKSKSQILVDHFCSKTKIKPPNSRQKLAWREEWLEPLNEILELTADDVTAACGLIDRALVYMRESGLTVARPQSIVNVTRTLQAKSSNGRSAGGDVWGYLLQQMAAVGSRGSPQVDDTTSQVIRACGGWQQLCQMDTREAERVFKSKYKQVAVC